MTTITIIGSGSMAHAIGHRAAQHGHRIEILSRSPHRAQELVERIGHGAAVGPDGATPAGEIVVLAVPAAEAVGVVTRYGEALAGRTLVDITNSFNADVTAVVTGPGRSVAEQIAAVAPAGASVVKAFNTLFAGVIAADLPVDGFFAGDDAAAKARVTQLLESLGMRPRDAGGLSLASALEWAGVLLVGVARHGAGFEAALVIASDDSSYVNGQELVADGGATVI